jgi:ribosomal protein S18 acetylase RimI-like enzyme
VVNPAYRNRGVGRDLLHKLLEIAAGKELEKLMFEAVTDIGEAAKGTTQLLGFIPVAVMPAHIKDYCGNTHDLIIMRLGLPKPEAEEPSIF